MPNKDKLPILAKLLVNKEIRKNRQYEPISEYEDIEKNKFSGEGVWEGF